MTARLATFLLFVVNGLIVGTWVASIPAITSDLGASAAETGVVLFCAALGALAAQPITGQLLTHMSSRRMLVTTSLVFPLLVPLPLLAPSVPLLALALLVFGAANGAMDVSMNAHGVALERASGRAMVSSLHAGWSIGGLLGAAGVAVAVAVGVDPIAETVAVGAVMWLVALIAGRSVGTGSARTVGAGRISLPSRAVLPIGLLAIGVALVEGGLIDWGGIYLRRGLGSDADVAAFAYAAFSLGMAAGRLGGDQVRERIGSVRMIQGGMILTALVVAAFLVVGDPAVALLGLGLAGVGVANVIPQAFNAAARIAPSGPSLAAVFTMGYSAFLVSPPVIGVVADVAGITLTLGLLVIVALVVAAGVSRVPAAETNPRFRPAGQGSAATTTPLGEGAPEPPV